MKITKKSLHESIRNQRRELIERLETPLFQVANQCRDAWGKRDKLNKVLIDSFDLIPHRTFLYVMDPHGIQVSDNISAEGAITDDFNRDRSSRPYMQQVWPGTQFMLSEAYISLRKKRPSLTAIQSIYDPSGTLLGYLGADFDLRDLPLTGKIYSEPKVWQQIKGDPSIRKGVFYQQRVESLLDANIDTVISVLGELMQDHGVYHVMLHFSSSRAVIWHYDDPYQYRLLDIDALTDPDMCLAFPRTDYPTNATIPEDKINDILEGLRQLRYMDETLYLRTGTLNIFNGLIGLTFSCDGSHYIPWQEFLDKDHVFWENTAVAK